MPISQRAYARHRGVSPEAVRKAIQSGRLVESLTAPNARGHRKIISAELADAEWARNTRSGAADDQPATPDTMALEDDLIDLNEARRRKEIELWRQARIKREGDELDLAHRRGELVSVADAQAQYEDAVTSAKSKLLGVPTRLRQRRPHLENDDIDELDELIREALEDLARG